MDKILLVDDHGIVRQGLRRILRDLFADPEQIDEASTGQQAISMVQKSCYRLVLLDISLPDRNGLDVLQQIRHFCPETAVVMLSMHKENEYSIRAFRAGASGYLSKASASDELLQAIRKVMQGEQYINAAVADLLLSEVKGERPDQPLHKFLSDRELQVVSMICNGRTPSEIANILCLSVKTVSTYKARIMNKLKIKTYADLINYCRDNDITL